MDVTHNWVPKHLYPQGCGYWKVYEHQIPLERDGVIGESIWWAANKCKSRWGWYFTEHDSHAVMTFEDPKEMVLWALRWQAEHRKQNGTCT